MNNLPESDILILKNIHFCYKDKLPVLKNISFSLKKGVSLGIIGPNGGGKSTLLKIIIGFLTPTSGQIFLQGEAVKAGSQFPPGTFAYVPQHTTLNTLMPLRVFDLLELGQLSTWTTSSRELSKNRDELDSILSLVGLLHKKDHLLSSLSGGEKQRALIAKALIHQPLILVLDEPHTGLDSTGQDQIFKILDKIKQEKGTIIIVVDHNLNLVIQHCDQLLCLNKTFHWHDHKKMLTKKVLESIYHCEFEHLLIHESGSREADHHLCEDEHGHQDHLHPVVDAPKNI